MVNYSKYLVFSLFMLGSITAHAQSSSNKFSPINRDLEVTRVTLEHYLKKWDEEPLLNIFRDSEADYEPGEGVKIRLVAENARIFMHTQGGRFETADNELMDTFFTDEIIELQRQRLVHSLREFLTEYHSYLPELKKDEQITFEFDVADGIYKRNGKELPASPLAHRRTYTLKITLTTNQLEEFNSAGLSLEAFKNLVKIETK